MRVIFIFFFHAPQWYLPLIQHSNITSITNTFILIQKNPKKWALMFLQTVLKVYWIYIYVNYPILQIFL